jgi:hypothetical protein
MGMTSREGERARAPALTLLDELYDKLDRLTSEAAKLALWIAYAQQSEGDVNLVSINTNEEWFAHVSKKVALPAPVVRKSLKELVNHGLLRKVGRSHLLSKDVSLSDHRGSLRSAQSSLDLADRPPWETETAGREGDREGGRGATANKWSASSETRTARTLAQSRAPQVTTTPKPDRICSLCGELQTPALMANAFTCANGHQDAPGWTPHKYVVDQVVRMYADSYDGAKLTVDGKAGAIVKRLLSVHTHAEIVRRARVMFYETRKWPPPPYHFGTLSVHFDTFIPMKKTVGGMADRDARKTGSTYYGEVDDV